VQGAGAASGTPDPDRATTSPPDRPGDDLPGQLAEGVAATLGRPARPRVVRMLPALPMLESGKADRQALLGLARTLLDAQRAPDGR
jgi:acyl-coenzyme A synthetase/AMP-(fatty) acid ligase